MCWGVKVRSLTSCRTSSIWMWSEPGWSRSAPTDCVSSARCPCPSVHPSACGLSYPVLPPAGPETECPEMPGTMTKRIIYQCGGQHMSRIKYTKPGLRQATWLINYVFSVALNVWCVNMQSTTFFMLLCMFLYAGLLTYYRPCTGSSSTVL